MKLALFLGFSLMVIPQWIFASNSTNLMTQHGEHKEILLDTVVRKLRNYWHQYGDDGNTFIGRCFGLAKRIRSLLPQAIFLMGVISTLLVFLTFFSMKTLGLVGALLLFNVSGAVAKLAAFFAGKAEKRPQTVHFHVHKDDDDYHHYPHGHRDYYGDHSGPGYMQEWDRTSRYGQDFDLDKLESYNLYNKLLDNLSTRY
ncbi:unnamed protein product [Phyllotreta striolata]|uniref:Uncharacterized protein n=1 Tax=Phyllotreta striolata TaxID=444603 RepID=A0A9N9XR68_PHYSR|nr:unnamed protein product [Phyllotreta striolata]